MSDDAAARFKPAYPFQELVGFRKTEFGDGFSRFELQLAESHMNRGGIPHGGVYAAMLDSALGSAGCYIGKDNDFRAAVTLNLNISFVAPPRGTTLVRGRPGHRRRTQRLFRGRGNPRQRGHAGRAGERNLQICLAAKSIAGSPPAYSSAPSASRSASRNGWAG